MLSSLFGHSVAAAPMPTFAAAQTNLHHEKISEDNLLYTLPYPTDRYAQRRLMVTKALDYGEVRKNPEAVKAVQE